MNAPATSRRLLRGLTAAALIIGLVAATGCGIYRRDKCYVDDLRYASMRDIFVESGSIELVDRRMNELQWLRCEKNEVLYRIKKEFEVPSE